MQPASPSSRHGDRQATVVESSGGHRQPESSYVRAPLWARLAAGYGAAMGLAAIAIILARVPDWGPGVIPVALIFVAPAYLLSRTAVMCVRIDTDGLRVRNPIHNYDIRWAEIEDIRIIDQSLGIGGFTQILRVGARPVTLAISNFGARGSSVAADRVAEPLKEALEDARARAPRSGYPGPARRPEKSADPDSTQGAAPTGPGDAAA